MSQSNEQVTDLYRTTFKSAQDMMNVCLGGIERLQAYQVGALEEMRCDHGEIWERIGSLSSIPEMQAAQAELARSQMNRMVSYWNGLVAVGCQCQAEILNAAQAKALEFTEDLGEKLEAAPAGAAPALSAMKLVMGAAQSTYAATVRATEEMARISAARIDTVKTSSTRQENAKTKRAA